MRECENTYADTYATYRARVTGARKTGSKRARQPGTRHGEREGSFTAAHSKRGNSKAIEREGPAAGRWQAGSRQSRERNKREKLKNNVYEGQRRKEQRENPLEDLRKVDS